MISKNSLFVSILALALLPVLRGSAAPQAPASQAPPVPPPVEETLVKDVVRLQGAATNKLMGEGLVVGLAGTGDKSAHTKKLALRLYKEMGGTFELADIDSKNVAAVIVTADLPSFKARGDTLDITVSSTEGAGSLKNGILLSTNLVGPGVLGPGVVKPVVAVATGPVLVGDDTPRPGATTAPGHLTVGRVVNGATVYMPVDGQIIRNNRITLLLRNPDFANAQRIAQSVNAEFEHDLRRAKPSEPATSLAQATSANQVEVMVPEAYRQSPVDFISRVMELPLTLVKERARVFVNARTGVVTYTGDVRLSATRISFGQDGEDSMVIEEGGTLSALLKHLDKVATPAKKIEVLNNLHTMGALRAELVIL